MNFFYYNIHNILRVKSNIRGIIPSYFESNEPLRKVDVSFIVRKRLKVISRSSLPLRIHIRSFDAFTEVQVETEKSIINEVLDSLLLAWKNIKEYNVFNNRLMPVLLLNRGCLILHAACVSIGNEGILITAPPNTGKTYTALSLTKMGFQFLSDDLTIIKG